ncbi:MAG: undecaprenyl-diphosphatase UppP [Clostridia bacterium]|nr:undecaprenyl-diphosphatase UppP [Clostridia bacterium]
MEFSLLAKTISWWEAIILGIVQGLAEFLPISSSGHLKLTETILGLDGMPRIFDVCLHIGTLLAVFIVFKDDLLSIIKNPKQKLTNLIIAATIPTVIIAVILEVLLDDNFSSIFLGYGFIITGILLYTMEMIPKKHACKDIDSVTYLDAVKVGCVQGIATMPGISRSGSTIAGGVFFGMDRKFLARFSFLMSIPAILGAFCWDVLKLFISTDEASTVTITVIPVILGMIAAFIVGYLAIRFMLKLIANKSFKPFAVYVLILGFLVCLDKFVTHIFF